MKLIKSLVGFVVKDYRTQSTVCINFVITPFFLQGHDCFSAINGKYLFNFWI